MLRGGGEASSGHSFPSRPTRLVPRGCFGLTVPADSEATNQKGDRGGRREKPRRYSCSGSPAAEAAAVPAIATRALAPSRGLQPHSGRPPLSQAGHRVLAFLPVGSAEAAGCRSGLLAVSSPGPKGGGDGTSGSRLVRELEGREAATSAGPSLALQPGGLGPARLCFQDQPGPPSAALPVGSTRGSCSPRRRLLTQDPLDPRRSAASPRRRKLACPAQNSLQLLPEGARREPPDSVYSINPAA